MKAFFRSFFASFLAVVVVLMIIVAFIVGKSIQKPKIKDHSYLVVDIYGEVLEYHPPASVMGDIFGGQPEILHRILNNLEKVCIDDRIDGVIVRLSSSNTAGHAMFQEIRGAIKKVRESGKKVYGFSDAINRKTYYLAAACDSIYMPPTAYINFLGFSTTTLHLKGALDKLGIKPNIHRIKDYKSAAEMIIRKEMSPESRENREWMLEEYWDTFVEALNEDRGFSEENIVEIMDHALFTAADAMEAGLIDRLLYWNDLEEMLKLEKDKRLRTVSQCRYAKVDPGKLGLKGKKKIAVVHAQGMIGGRQSKIDPWFGVLMGHESVAADLKRARKDKDIAAVVFRVDSRGGEGLASDLIGHEVEVVSGVKPIVASMVDVAASGGYHISYRASKIVADPLTITGSIGSISGKFNMKGLYDKLGITHDAATKGPKALMFSDYRDFTEDEWKCFVDDHWAGFNAWLKDVAEHRGMTFEEAEKLAHGRVWSGKQAKENGLVDELGGIDRAIELAKELAGIPADEKVTVVHYPKKKGLLEMIFSGGGFTTATQWIIYHFIRDDLAETWRMLTEEPLYMIDEDIIE